MKKSPTLRSRIDLNRNFFKRLGLSWGECRIMTIREAAKAKAREVSLRSHPATSDLHRAEIAVATYRLLDPRGRTALYERIQLSCPLDWLDTLPEAMPAVSNLNRSIDFAEKNEGTENVEFSSVSARPIAPESLDVALEAVDASIDRVELSGSDLSLVERQELVSLLKTLEDDSSEQSGPSSWFRSCWKR
jgi:hypothetical protein